MKCPACGGVQKYKQGMTCVKADCKYRFVFNPKTDGMTDARMVAFINRASANGTYFVTANQIYAAYCRRATKGWLASVIVGLAIACFGLAILILVEDEMRVLGLLAIIAGVVAVGLGHRLKTRAPARSKFNPLLRKWLTNGLPSSVERVIDVPRLRQPPPEWREKDIYDYGFERLLIVERDELVDLFVLNGFHAEQRTLVISESGYPDYLIQHVSKAVAENPNLVTYLLHDATPHGEAMLQRVQQPQVFSLADRKIIDLGIFPSDVARLRGMKKIHADQQVDGVPIDFILFQTLASGIALGMEKQLPLSQLINYDQPTTSFG